MTLRFVPTFRTRETFRAFFDELNWSTATWPPLNDQEIRAWCQVYLECPFIPPDPRFIKLLQYRFMAVVDPKMSSSAKEDAAMVDSLVELGGRIGDARKNVADKTRKSVEAVTKAHLKYGSKKAMRGGVRPRSKEDIDKEKQVRELVTQWKAKPRKKK